MIDFIVNDEEAIVKKLELVDVDGSHWRTESAASSLITVASIETSRSMKAYGNFQFSPKLEVAFYDFKSSNSSVISGKKYRSGVFLRKRHFYEDTKRIPLQTL